jgi:uncharacterized membrane protein HdeD (DUF308 family)
MISTLNAPTTDTLTSLGRHWGWVAAYGIITVLAGLAALVWPAPTIVVLAVLFGIQLIVAGVYRFIAAFGAADASGVARVLYALLGIFSIIVGLYALRHVLLTIVALPLILGIFWVINGVIELFTALVHREMPGRGWIGVTGVLSILVGLLALSYPAITLLGLTLVLGIWLLVLGISQIGLAFRLRSIARRAR